MEISNKYVNDLLQDVDEDIADFMGDIFKVYNKHNLCIEPQDSPRAFEIHPLNERAVEWLGEAPDCRVIKE